jgi:uncharacterized integral membrane protein (TIGR00698 family)
MRQPTRIPARNPGLVLGANVVGQLLEPIVPRAAFFALLVFVAVPSRFTSPAVALALGVGFGVLAPHPYAAGARKASKLLLQASVVTLGFAMSLRDVLAAGRSGFLYTLASIAFVLVAGALLGRAFGVPKKLAYLISVGTAICGGSAIAAIGPASDASDDEMSVSIGTVFVLNAAGLVLFPLLGHFFGLSQNEFGLWAALAIHDTSSVVGAGAKYGAVALMVATTVKLARALWIVPLTIATAGARSRRAEPVVRATQEKKTQNATQKKKTAWPWFILFFLAAALVRAALPSFAPVYSALAGAGNVGLSVTLFLIGTGMSLASLRKVGVRPMLHGTVLWILVAVVSLLAIRGIAKVPDTTRPIPSFTSVSPFAAMT